MTRKEALKFITLRTIGNFLLLFSLYGVGATFGPALYYELQYQIIKTRGIQYTVAPLRQDSAGQAEQPVTPGFGQILAGSTQQLLVPKDTQFSIVIPKIGASAKVFPNIDPEKEDEFLPILTEGIAHAKGTVFPGMKGNVYLFAHSTDSFWNVGRYNALFYLLKDVKVGEEVVIFFEGRRYEYIVTENKIGDADDVHYITESRHEEQKLILQTCWPPGTTWKRIFVTAIPKNVDRQ